jgi:DICT domain-containing protein
MLYGSILQQLETPHRYSTRPIHFGVYYKNTLVALCHALEDHVLTKNDQPLVIAAFQQGKWYAQEAQRYIDIAEHSRAVVIMAADDAGFLEHPTSKLDNVDLVGLKPGDPVCQEWHLIILSPEYTAMVICQELSEADYSCRGLPTTDLERKFYGLWTFEPELVKETANLAIAHIQEYNPQLAERLTTDVNKITTTSSSLEDVSTVVTRVIDYLKTEQDHIYTATTKKVQSLDRNLVSNEIQAFLRMAQLMDLSDINNPMAATEVAGIVETMGQLLDLPAWQVKRLRLAALLHRIDPMQKAESVIYHSHSSRYEDNPNCPLTCSLIPGVQVLRTMPRLRAVAQIITHQTEWWDGTGEPTGLAGDDIPLESRILALAAEYQWQLSQYKYSDESGIDIFSYALDHCRQQQSTRFDPKLVDTLTLLVMGLQQGLDLPLLTPKFSSGIWLLDTRWDSQNKHSQQMKIYPQ